MSHITEKPQGVTGECCKENGTYASEAGAKQYFEVGECFGKCPETGRETNWERVT